MQIKHYKKDLCENLEIMNRVLYCMETSKILGKVGSWKKMYFSTQPSKSKLLLLSYLWLCRDCNFNNLFSFSAESYPEAVKISLTLVFRWVGASIPDQSMSVTLQKYPSQNQKSLNFSVTEVRLFHMLPRSWDRELNILGRMFL